MAYENEIVQALNNLWLKSFQDTLIPGRLGVLTSSTPTYDVEAERAGYVYVSLGVNGERGRAIALDKVGVDTTAEWQEIRMRREKGELVIREATTLSGGGGGGSVSDLEDLADVVFSSLADGDTIQYDSGSGNWVNVVPSGGAGGAPSPHALSGAHHSGLLDWADIDTSGSNLTDITTRAHAALQGITANDHHNQVHSITGSDHTITGSQYQLVGATGTNTLGLLTPSSSPGAAAAILRTSSTGGLSLDTTLFVVNGSTNNVSIDGTLFAVDADDNTVLIGSTLFAADTDTSVVSIDTTLFTANATTEIVTIDTNLIYADAINKWVGINKTPAGAAMDVVAFSNADHTQRLKQKSGQTGRLWRIESSGGQELIVLDSQGNLQSGNPGFVSGLTGWQITPTGNAEFNNVWVRGELHATVFVKDEIHATGGTFFVATAGKMYADADIDATTSDTETLQFEQGSGLEDWEIEQGSGLEVLEVEAVLNYIEIEDPPSGPGFYFQVGDVVRSKTEVDTGVTDFWLEILHGVQLDGFSRYSVLKRSGTDGVLPAGAAVVSYGVPGDGRILMTSDLNYAPYLDVFTVGPNVWTGAAGAIIPHVRLGRLDGVGVTGTSGIEQYGMIAGTDLSDANSPYIIASNLGLRLHKVNLTLNDGTSDTGELTAEGNFKLGTNVGTTNGTSFQVISEGATAGDVIIGRLSGNYMHWDQSLATLTVSGTISVGGTPVDFGDLATTTYVDTAESDAISTAAGDATTKANAAQSTAISTAAGDATTKANAAQAAAISAAASDATTKANAAQAAAQTYSNDRRITRVTGTWTSTDSDTITWTSVSIRTASGVNKSVTNGNTGNMTGQRWLYTDLSATEPLTLSVATSATSIPVGNTIVAVCAPGADAATVQVIGGTTWISGDQIVTGSIVTGNIQTGAVTAVKIFGTTLSAIKTDTGSLDVTGNITVGTSGAIKSTGKDDYNDSTGGFFMGYSGGQYRLGIGTGSNYLRWDGFLLEVAGNISTSSVDGTVSVGTSGAIRSGTKAYGSGAGFWLGYDSSAYKLDVGDGSANRLLFDGTTLQILTTSPINISRNAGGAMLTMSSSGGVGSILFTHPNISFSQPILSPTTATFTKLVVSGDTFQIATQRAVATSTSAGIPGEICWSWAAGYLYLCIAANTWRRQSLITGAWEGVW